MSRSGRGALLGLVALVGCAQLWLLDADPELRELRRRAVELRGLDFVRPVALEWVEPGGVREVVRAELDEMLEPRFARDYRDAWAAVGLLPPDIDLVETFLEVNAEQIAGLYSIARRRMFVVRGPGEIDAPLVIHELVHALQHQHFGRVLELMQGLRRNDDALLALAAAAEGDATWIMLAAQPGANGAVAPGVLESMRVALQLDLERPVGALARAPAIVRTSMLYPYVAGLALAEQRQAAGGLDALLRDPPLSTHAVRRLHERPATGFVGLPLDWLAQRLEAQGCALGHDNVLGVLGVRVLMSDHGGPARGWRGWRGDRFVHARCGATPELLWVSRWADADAAAAFAQAHDGIAAAIAERAGGAPARARIHGRDAIVATPGIEALAGAAHERSVFRSFADLDAWIAADCFPESPCPGL